MLKSFLIDDFQNKACHFRFIGCYIFSHGSSESSFFTIEMSNTKGLSFAGTLFEL